MTYRSKLIAGPITLVLGAGIAFGAEHAASATFVSDGSTGTGVGHFRYYGRWEHVHGARDGRFLRSSSRSFSPGAVVTLTFVGSAVRVYGVRGPGGGRAVVTLDRIRRPDVDFYAAHKEVRAIVFESSLLERGLHTLAMAAVSDPRVPGRRHSYINISGAAYQ